MAKFAPSAAMQAPHAPTLRAESAFDTERLIDVDYVLAVDVEASGPSMSEHFMPCFGTALVHVATQRVCATHIARLPQPSGTTWDERTLEEFWAVHPSAHRQVCTHLRDYARQAATEVGQRRADHSPNERSTFFSCSTDDDGSENDKGGGGDGDDDDDDECDREDDEDEQHVAERHAQVIDAMLRREMRAWVTWCRDAVRTHTPHGATVRMVSDNAAFDGAWLSTYLARYVGDDDTADDGASRDRDDTASLSSGTGSEDGATTAPPSDPLGPVHDVTSVIETDAYASVVDTTSLAQGVSWAYCIAPWRSRSASLEGLGGHAPQKTTEGVADVDVVYATGTRDTEPLPPTTALTVFAALGVAERREQLLAEMDVRHDHNPMNDAVVIGVQAALILHALHERAASVAWHEHAMAHSPQPLRPAPIAHANASFGHELPYIDAPTSVHGHFVGGTWYPHSAPTYLVAQGSPHTYQ